VSDFRSDYDNSKVFLILRFFFSTAILLLVIFSIKVMLTNV